MIRLATLPDLPALLGLFAQLSTDNPPLDPAHAEATFHQMLANPALSVFVAEKHGRLAGTTTLILVPNLTRGGRPFGVIENVVTDQSFRGTGIGKALIAHCVKASWAQNAYKVMLMTGRKDAATLGFYRACGFVSGTKTAFEIRSNV